MIATRRQRIAMVSAALAVIAGALFARVGYPFINLATAYKAKVLCSEVFVAGRTVRDVAAGLVVDDLAALRAIDANVDTVNRAVDARLSPFPERVARYDEALGCTLVNRGSQAIQATGRRTAAQPLATLRPSVRDSFTIAAGDANSALVKVVEEAFTEPNPDRPRRTRAVVVLQHGMIVAERYASGVGPETPMIGWSMAKSVVNALVGVAVRQGVVRVDDQARVREWSAPDDGRRMITVNHLLHMSSGLRFEEGGSDPTSDLLTMLYGSGDMAAVALDQPLEAPPGTRWKYSSGTTIILSRLLRSALGDDAYRRFPQTALFEPLGMTSAVMEADASGTFVGSSYMYATARDWARFGQLYLQDGVWNSARILPDGWVQYTRTPAPAAPDAIYGAHFWLRTPAEYRGPAASVPADAFHAVGHEGQFLTIIPSYDAVIVRLGRTRGPDSWAHDRFIAAVVATLRPPR